MRDEDSEQGPSLSEPGDGTPETEAGEASTVPAARSGPDRREIGPYRLLERIGSGGMGEVYLAEERRPIRRRVALKIIKPGLDTDEVVRRFENERQALAMMDHPSIARVYAAGATDRGRPYFAMEYVPGVPITEHCDTRRLTCRQRLELFCQVCHGVQHAHQKAIIHRDLKPSNILVTTQDDDAVPKIIDFGVAKAIGRGLTEETLHTEFGRMLGTPEYMSPEQADLGRQDIDTRTDVYSLGVVLYELLVGSRPFEPADLRRGSASEICRKIRESEPAPPSSRISRLGDASSTSATNRKTTPAKLRECLRGDLDRIVLMAMAKDRTRRYGSATELAADIDRHLLDLPVVACPPGLGYRVGKFVKRNRIAVSAAASILLLLVVLAVSMTIQAGRTARERDRALAAEARARSEAETAAEVSAFLVDLFRVSNPSEARGNSVTAREILDRGSERIEMTLADQPDVQATMMATMGEVYLGLGLYQQALDLAEDALRIRQSIHVGDHPDLVESMMLLAQAHIQRGELDRAESIGRDALAASRRVDGDHDARTADCLQDLAVNLSRQNRLEEAEDLYRQALAVRRTLEPADRRAVASTLTSLGELLRGDERLDEAETVHREALQLVTSIDEAVSPLKVSILNNLALVAEARGDLDASETRLREVHDHARELYGEQSPLYATAKSNLAGTLWRREKIDEAETLHRQALAIRRAALRPDHPDVAASLNNLSLVVRDRGDLDECVSLLEEALAIVRAAYGESHVRVGITLSNLGMFQEERQDYREALRRYLETEPIFAGFLPPDHWRVGKLRNSIGLMLAHDGQFDRGEPLLLAGYETIRLARGDTDRRTRRALARVIRFYELAGRNEDATRWRQVLESVTPEG